MTAYGRSSLMAHLGRFVTEIQSVNRKFLEIHVHLPPELSRFDAEIKKWIAAKVTRGQINVRLTAVFDRETPMAVHANLPLARQIKKAWEEIANDLQIVPEEGFQLSMLKDQAGILLFNTEIANEEEYRQVIRQIVEDALVQLLEMKNTEGATLTLDISGRLDKLQDGIHLIASKSTGATDKYRKKLVERLEELMPGAVENEDRILREISLYAEKIDIEEEITRFNSHLAQFKGLLAFNESVGKTLEFIVQELNREINTIGSKTSEIEISRLVIDIKSELERIREQIQNIE